MRHRNAASSAPWVAPTIVAAAFGLTEAASAYAPGLVLRLVPWAAVLATAAAFWGGFIVARRRGRIEAAAFASTATLLVPAAFGCYLLAETVYARRAIAVVAVLLLSLYLAYSRGIVRGDSRFIPEDFSHLSFSVHAVTAFFAWYAAAALPDFVRFPLPASAAVIAAFAFAAGAETMRRSGLRPARALRVGVAVSVIAVESFLALTFLPISDMASAAVGTVILVTGLHAAVTYLVAPPVPQGSPFRRQLAFSCLLVAMLLTTARWA